MSARFPLWWLAVAAVVIAVGAGAWLVRGAQLGATQVTTAGVGTDDLTPQVFGIGTTEARRTYLIGPTQAARVARVLVDHGQSVSAGQVLAELDPVDLEERERSAGSALERAQAAVVGAEAGLREAVSRSDLAASSAARFAELRARGFVSKEAADGKQHEARAAAAGRDAAAAALTAARRDIARLSADRAAAGRLRAQYRLKSPVDGIVLAREAEPGSTVLAGQAVVRVLDPRSLWVRARVDQARAGGLDVGQPARIALRSRPLAPLAGRIARIEIASDSVTEERVVALDFDALPPGLSTGELAEVTIDLPRIDKALWVPAAAVHRVGGKTGVWRVDGGRIAFAAIEVGITTLDGRTELRAGLARGDHVVLHAPHEMREGETVRVVERLAPR